MFWGPCKRWEDSGAVGHCPVYEQLCSEVVGKQRGLCKMLKGAATAFILERPYVSMHGTFCIMHLYHI